MFKKKTKPTGKSELVLILIFIVLSLFLFVRPIQSNGNGHSLTLLRNFEFSDYTIEENGKFNASSIDINLPSSSWQIQDIELNFTEIKFTEEIETIEEVTHNSPNNYSYIYYQQIADRVHGLGVQIKLTEPTTLYGTYLFGYKQVRGIPIIIQIQIRGYDSLNNHPNNTLYLSQDINMSSTIGWYHQNFSTPLILPKGNYFLVLNGTNLNAVQNDRYFWYRNDIDPKYPDLYTSNQSESFPWTVGTQNSTFLYKLHQKINTPPYPEVINMTINVGGVYYQIPNGPEVGSGFLPITTVNFSPASDSYEIIVSNNASDTLLFNATYKTTLSREYIAPSTILIDGSRSNLWTLTPTIIREADNQSVLFFYPSSWQNITVLKDEVNITQDVIINPVEHSILITNNSISSGASWEIIAHTPNIPFSINAPITEFEVGNPLQFTITNPVLSGNYTFFLVNPTGYEDVPGEVKTIPPDSNSFSYLIPTYAIGGDYTAYMYWNNATDAGVQIQVFKVSIPGIPPPPPGPDIPWPLIIIIIVSIGAAVGIGAFIGIKRIHATRKDKLEKVLQKCIDIINLDYIIVLDNKSGIDVYSQSFGEKKLDTTLLSGFLQAIQTFGSEVSQEAKESRTLKLEYKDSIILTTEFVNLRLIAIIKDNPSPNFLYILEDLAYDIYKNYGSKLDNFSGILKDFGGIKDLIEKHLNISFLYPLEVVRPEAYKLNKDENEILNRAQTYMEDHGVEYFHALYLLPENISSPKDYQTILGLIKKGVFQPTTKNND